MLYISALELTEGNTRVGELYSVDPSGLFLGVLSSLVLLYLLSVPYSLNLPIVVIYL